jgi:DNA-binding transcriptional ArsR family regulator
MLKHQDIDAVLKALAEPTRRQILERLTEGPSGVSALAEPFDMSLAAIVQHLQVLEECGLIKTEKIGRVRTCRIEPGGLAGLSQWIADRKTPAERRLDRLGDLLNEMDPES